MAKKRDLKKYIRNTCGALAGEICFARCAFPVIDRKTVYDILVEIAALQGKTISKVSVSFAKTPSDYLEKEVYKKERTAYYAKAYKSLLDEFDASVLEIVKKMNAALPAEVREKIKEAIAE